MNFPAWEKNAHYHYEPVMRQVKRNFSLYLKLATSEGEKQTEMLHFSVLDAIQSSSSYSMSFNPQSGKPLIALMQVYAPMFVCLNTPEKVYFESHLTALVTTERGTQAFHLDKRDRCFPFYPHETGKNE
jgi:hypothetical protein